MNEALTHNTRSRVKWGCGTLTMVAIIHYTILSHNTRTLELEGHLNQSQFSNGETELAPKELTTPLQWSLFFHVQ